MQVNGQGRVPKTAKSCTTQKVCSAVHGTGTTEMGTHRESARSGDADDDEGAEVDGALPRRRRLARDRDVLLGLGLVLRLGLAGLAHLLDFDRPGLLMHGASLGLCRVLDSERAGLVVSSTDAVVLPKGKECDVLGSREVDMHAEG